MIALAKSADVSVTVLAEQTALTMSKRVRSIVVVCAHAATNLEKKKI